MGCTTAKGKKKINGLSEDLREKILGIFRQMDQDGSKTIEKEETLKFWKSNFAKLNTEELFKHVDFDNSGKITENEWMVFWEIVKKSGHSEEEIDEEIEQLRLGKAWVKFSKVDKYIKREKSMSIQRGNSTTQNAIIEEQKFFKNHSKELATPQMTVQMPALSHGQ